MKINISVTTGAVSVCHGFKPFLGGWGLFPPEKKQLSYIILYIYIIGGDTTSFLRLIKWMDIKKTP